MAIKNSRLTQDRLKEVLSYCPLTGVFTSKLNRTNVKIGQVLGCLKLDGYIQMQIDNIVYPAHRLAFLYMEGDLDDMTDHIDGDKSNNIFSNLRRIQPSENNKNQPRYSNNKTGVTGVCRPTHSDKWLAQIRTGNKNIYLGYHDTLFDAVCARKSAEIKYGFHANHGR